MKLCHARTACMRAVLAQQAEAYQRWGPDRATKIGMLCGLGAVMIEYIFPGFPFFS